MKDIWIKPWVTAALLALPIAVLIIYPLAAVYNYNTDIHTVFLERVYSITLTFLLLVATIPYSLREYLRDRFIRSIEKDIPTFLSAVEAGLIAGMSVYNAYKEAAKQTKTLGSLVNKILRGVRVGSAFEEEVDKHIPHDTYLLRIFKEYLKLLVVGGEELYRTMTDIRNIFEKLVTFRSSLHSNASQTASVFLTILGVYIAVLVMIVKMFLEGITQSSIINISQQAVNTVESIGAYMIYIQAIGSGIVISILSGSRRYYMLLLTVISSILGLIGYAYFIIH
ncbi:MAG: hypothetical protein GSR79_08715 [Desulfurococcales archaeon]|nr:hypothetical protein [Desulfurococcales archaeon]